MVITSSVQGVLIPPSQNMIYYALAAGGGLSISELAEQLHVSRMSVHDWERGKFTPREGLVSDLLALREAHDRALDELADYHETQGGIIELPAEPMPQGWYRALGARLLDQYPDAMLEWAE